MNIIDTKSDLAFKKVFGEKPHLLMSLLNNFLPLPYPIVEIQYMSPEILPDTDENKNSIVDVRCTDNHGRHFIVEMQVARQTGFNKRVLMNTSKIYSRQLTKNKQYDLAQPVYSLNLLDHTINQSENDWYHYFAFTLESVEAKNFSPEKIYGYELYVDSIRQYHTTMSLERKAGWKEGVAEGEELGKQIGLETSLQIIQEIKKNILSPEEIAIQFNTNVEMVLSLKSIV